MTFSLFLFFLPSAFLRPSSWSTDSHPCQSSIWNSCIQRTADTKAEITQFLGCPYEEVTSQGGKKTESSAQKPPSPRTQEPTDNPWNTCTCSCPNLFHSGHLFKVPEAPFHSFLFLPQSTLLGRSGNTLIHNARFSNPVLNPAIGPVPTDGVLLCSGQSHRTPMPGFPIWIHPLPDRTSIRHLGNSILTVS